MAEKMKEINNSGDLHRALAELKSNYLALNVLNAEENLAFTLETATLIHERQEELYQMIFNACGFKLNW